jgi:hypothetical protein
VLGSSGPAARASMSGNRAQFLGLVQRRWINSRAHSTVKCNGQIVDVDENLTRGSVAEYLSGA